MKLKMARNSLFAILLRSPWWISIVIALVPGLLGVAALPDGYRAVGALSGLPFAVIGVIAARRQWHQPSPARVAEVQRALALMAWPAFAALLEQALGRDGCTVHRGKGATVDFELERDGRRTLVRARRWKSARIGIEELRGLQTAREAAGAAAALYIGLGDVGEGARTYAAQQGMMIWQATELARELRGLPLGGAAAG